MTLKCIINQYYCNYLFVIFYKNFIKNVGISKQILFDMSQIFPVTKKAIIFLAGYVNFVLIRE